MQGSKQPSRRDILKAGAAALAAPYVITSSALGAEGRPPASERVTLAYIGMGGRGRGNMQEALSCADAQVLAVCDVWDQRRDLAKSMVDKHYGSTDCSAYVDFREILDRRDVDAVSIASPDHWHVPMAVMAAKAGKDVSVEKPLGMSIAEDQICRDLVKRYERVFQYGSEARMNAAVRFGCELIRNGRVGELREIRVKAPTMDRIGVRYSNGAWAPSSDPKVHRYIHGVPPQPKPAPKGLNYDLWLGPAPWRPHVGCHESGHNWFHVYDYSLGFIAGWGAHPLDLMQWAFDTHLDGPWEVEGTGVIPTPAEGLNDAIFHWDVRIRLASGVAISFFAHTMAKDEPPGFAHDQNKNPYPQMLGVAGNYVQFIGSEGWIAIPYSGEYCSEPKSLCEAKLGPNAVRLPVGSGQERNFIECVRTRRQPVCDIDDAVRTDSLCHISDIAIRTGRRIVWDPIKEEIIGDEEASRRLSRAMRVPWQI